MEPKEANIQQQPSGGTANQAINKIEVSNDEAQTEEFNLPKFDLGAACGEKDKKPNKKGCNGTIPKTAKKPPPALKSAPNSNQSTLWLGLGTRNSGTQG